MDGCPLSSRCMCHASYSSNNDVHVKLHQFTEIEDCTELCTKLKTCIDIIKSNLVKLSILLLLPSCMPLHARRIESCTPNSKAHHHHKSSSSPPSNNHKKHRQKKQPPPIMLGDHNNDPGKCTGNGDQSVTCIADAGSICKDMSGGLITDPRCTCNTDADCPPAPSHGKPRSCFFEGCGPYPHNKAAQTYKGNVCNYNCQRMPKY